MPATSRRAARASRATPTCWSAISSSSTPARISRRATKRSHIVADEGRFGSQPATFYGAWVAHSGVDARSPLGTRYRARLPERRRLLRRDRPHRLARAQRADAAGGHLRRTAELRRPVPVSADHRLRRGGRRSDPRSPRRVNEVATRLTVGSGEVPVAATFGFVDIENRIQPSCARRAARRLPVAELGDADLQCLRALQPRAQRLPHRRRALSGDRLLTADRAGSALRPGMGWPAAKKGVH